jgi:hypothetical protein
VFLFIFGVIAALWLVALMPTDQSLAVRLAIATGATAILLVMPGGLACIFWLSSSEFRKQHRHYRRGGPPPGYAPDALWQTSSVGRFLRAYMTTKPLWAEVLFTLSYPVSDLPSQRCGTTNRHPYPRNRNTIAFARSSYAKK